jgi:hypothetical protein
MQTLDTLSNKKNSILFYLSLASLILLEMIVNPIVELPISLKIYLIVFLGIINFATHNKINIIRISVIGIFLSVSAIDLKFGLMDKTLFRYLVLMVSFVCLDIMSAEIQLKKFYKCICYIFSLYTVLLLCYFFKLYIDQGFGSLPERISGFAMETGKGVVNPVSIGIYSGLSLVFSKYINNKYVIFVFQTSSIIIGILTGSRIFVVFFGLFILINIKHMYKLTAIMSIFIYLSYDRFVLIIQRFISGETAYMSRTFFIKQFLDDYDLSPWGNGLNSTAFMKNDGSETYYNDMSSIIHILNDLGLFFGILIIIFFIYLLVIIYIRKDHDSLLFMAVVGILSVASSNITTPANISFYITWIGLFTIFNKYINRPVRITMTSSFKNILLFNKAKTH